MTAEDISFYTEKYGDMILRLSFSYLKNLADAEDAVQDVFIKLLEKNVHFESAEHEKAWFTRVTINVCKNKLRMFWNRNTCSLDDIGELPYQDQYGGDNTVLSAVLSLPEGQRTAIHLYYYEGYKTPEIAALTGKRETTVRSDLHRARLFFRYPPRQALCRGHKKHRRRRLPQRQFRPQMPSNPML